MRRAPLGLVGGGMRLVEPRTVREMAALYLIRVLHDVVHRPQSLRRDGGYVRAAVTLGLAEARPLRATADGKALLAKYRRTPRLALRSVMARAEVRS